MKLTRTSIYACASVLLIAKLGQDRPMSAKRLAEEGNMPDRYLLQVLRSLAVHGILVARRGVEGGYTLNRKPEEINLLQIIEAVEGPVGIHQVANFPQLAATESPDVATLVSILANRIEAINDDVRQFLQQTSIAKILRQSTRKNSRRRSSLASKWVA